MAIGHTILWNVELNVRLERKQFRSRKTSFIS